MSLVAELTADRLQHDEEKGWRRDSCFIIPEWWDDQKRIAAVPRLFLSGTSATELGVRRRWVDDPKFPVGWGEIARAYIDRALQGAKHRVKPGSIVGRGRVPWRKEALGFLPFKSGLYLSADAPRTGRMAVVDIDRAYWQIASAATADMFFRVRGDEVHWLVGRVEWPRVADTFEMADLGRSIVGMLGSTGMKWRRYGVLSHPKTAGCPAGCRGPHNAPSGLMAPDLVGMVAWTLQAVAVEAVERFGARMWMTDAAVVPTDRVEAYQAWLASRWHLSSRVVHRGPTMIYGANRYRCGEHQTRDVANGDTQLSGPYDNLLVVRPAVRDGLADMRERLLGREREEPPWST